MESCNLEWRNCRADLVFAAMRGKGNQVALQTGKNCPEPQILFPGSFPLLSPKGLFPLTLEALGKVFQFQLFAGKYRGCLHSDGKSLNSCQAQQRGDEEISRIGWERNSEIFTDANLYTSVRQKEPSLKDHGFRCRRELQAYLIQCFLKYALLAFWDI